MHLHILGVCGTFMAGIAALGRALGHRVTGSDANAYPPMSDQLAELGIEVHRGYAAKHLLPPPDLVIVGNALSRGNVAIEALLDQRLRFTSGPAWLYQSVLEKRTVLAVAGTHGKTSTASMLAWIFEYTGLNPGFLIGGVPQNFGISARLGGDGPFIVEADEYDSAFFDKRAKFVHYYPHGLIINNIEFDHADIFDSMADIRRQFHHLIRTVAANGRIIINTPDQQIEQVLRMGIWTPVERSGIGNSHHGCWHGIQNSADYRRFSVSDGHSRHNVAWGLLGEHNARNAVLAMAMAIAFGIAPAVACEAMAYFQGVRRRFECLGTWGEITLYEDFAHHPTAIAATLQALRANVGSARILAVVDLASNTMRAGIHHAVLCAAVKAADRAWFYQCPDSRPLLPISDGILPIVDSISDLVASIKTHTCAGDHLLIMSNGSIVDLKKQLTAAL